MLSKFYTPLNQKVALMQNFFGKLFAQTEQADIYLLLVLSFLNMLAQFKFLQI
jgi:hypothetical protein